ncbi:(d)CMP kinase [Dongia deserti]|uniref:(d)CMP kinase n=1 Tax=Dongia deserti TaxID=2268030 RepID=UPI000E648E34|nr:(d)CMP kinase [Dongia deserti]
MTEKPRLIITVDGPSAAGKGTLARRLADHFGFEFLDTGALYRGVGLSVLRQGLDPADENAATAAAKALKPEILGEPALRAEETSTAASKVAAIPSVRAAILNWQRDFARSAARNSGGAVLDGRDIGTVVCPDADAKLFVTASLEARADRRVKELQARGETAIYARVLQDMQERDARDQGRSISPTKPATDALTIDTSDLTADQVFERALAFIATKMKA